METLITGVPETGPDLARRIVLTPLAEWVLTYTCGRPVQVELTPEESRNGLGLPMYPIRTCMLFKGHAGRGIPECSPKWVRG